MQRIMMKSKIHRATITGADLNYVGSITLDPRLMELADIREHEQVHVLDIDNGARFETYAIEGGPGDVILNGAAARLVHPGDKIIVITLRAVRRGRARGLRTGRRARRRAQPTRPCTRSARSRRNPATVPGSLPSCLCPPSTSWSSAAVSPVSRPRCAPGTRDCRSPCSPRVSSAGPPPATRRAGWPPRSIVTDDSPELHGSDTLAAGGGLCDTDAVRVLANEGPERVRELIALGAHFDQVAGRDELARAREGGHSVAACRARRRRRHRRRDRARARGRGPGVRRRRPRGLVGVRPARRGRPRRRRARDRTRRRRGAAGAPRRDRDRRRGAVLRRHHQPGAVDRRRDRHGHAGRRRGRRPRVHAVPPDRAAPPVDAAAAPLRGAAR